MCQIWPSGPPPPARYRQGNHGMQLRKVIIAFAADEETRLIVVLLTILRDEFRRQRHDLERLLGQAGTDPAGLLRLLEASHDLGEQADHLLLAIARNQAAQHLQRQAEDLFDGFRSIEAAVDAALTQKPRS